MSESKSPAGGLAEAQNPVTDYSNVVVADGCPVVKMDKYEKLCGFLRKTFASVGTLVEDVYLPVEGSDPDKQVRCDHFVRCCLSRCGIVVVLLLLVSAFDRRDAVAALQ